MFCLIISPEMRSFVTALLHMWVDVPPKFIVSTFRTKNEHFFFLLVSEFHSSIYDQHLINTLYMGREAISQIQEEICEMQIGAYTRTNDYVTVW